MSNILFVGSYREKTGFGIACENFILALDAGGANIACRPVKIRKLGRDVHPRILELENKKYDSYDYVIQKVLPHSMDYSGEFKKNIAILAYETSNLGRTNWDDKLNLMDEVWATNDLTRLACLQAGVTTPIKIVGEPVDTTKYSKKYTKMYAPTTFDSTFKFYFIGENTSRKNLEALVLAFHLEFAPEEDVALVMKTSKQLTSSQDTQNEVATMCNNIKQTLRLYDNMRDYKGEIIITDSLSDDQICSLHQMADCFVMPSCGEGWCMPAMDALGFGNPVICGDAAGIDFVEDGRNGFYADMVEAPVVHTNAPLTDLYTGWENWHKIDVQSLRHQMREAFHLFRDEPKTWEKMKDNARSVPEYWNMENVGKRLLGNL